MCAPVRNDGRSRNGPPADVRCAVMMALPTEPNAAPPRGPRGVAAAPLSAIRVPGTSSGLPTYGTTVRPRTPIDGMLNDAGDCTRALVARTGAATTTDDRDVLTGAATLAVVPAVEAEASEVDVAACPAPGCSEAPGRVAEPHPVTTEHATAADAAMTAPARARPPVETVMWSSVAVSGVGDSGAVPAVRSPIVPRDRVRHQPPSRDSGAAQANVTRTCESAR